MSTEKGKNESTGNVYEGRDARGRFIKGHQIGCFFKPGNIPKNAFKPGNIPKNAFKPGNIPKNAFKPGHHPRTEFLPGERRGLATEISPGEHRSPATEFKPGENHNPKGRPRLTEQQKETLAKIKALAPRAVEVLDEILNDETAPAIARLKAVTMVLDRAYGKAPNKVDLTDPYASAQAARARLESIFTQAAIQGRDAHEVVEVQAVVVDDEPDRKGWE